MRAIRQRHSQGFCDDEAAALEPGLILQGFPLDSDAVAPGADESPGHCFRMEESVVKTVTAFLVAFSATVAFAAETTTPADHPG